ncbi:MAG: hypothetical protein EAY66_00290, partial [Sphingobacteriales bacterium]
EDGMPRFKNFNLTFTNNIVWGNVDNEFLINNTGNKPFVTNVKSNLLKTNKSYDQSNRLNTDPLFQDAKKDNYLLAANSPAQNTGIDLSLNPYYNQFIKFDLKNILRTFPSDLGCFEIK